MHADDVFAGRAGEPSAWRRVYPRRQKVATVRRLLTSATRHPLLATTVCVMFAVWIAIAALAAHASHRAHTRAPNMLSEIGRGVISTPGVRGPLATPIEPTRPSRRVGSMRARTDALAPARP